MAKRKKGRKEPTTVFSIRCPVSMESAAFDLAQRMDIERNAFVVEAISEKIAREKRRAARRVA